MMERSSLVRAAAIRIAKYAFHLFPQDRSGWAKALINEVHHVPGDIRALRWATGVVVTAIHERIRSMKSGSLLIPRWLLAIEMLVCFVPLTLLGVAVMWAAISGVMPLPSAALYLSVVAVAPLGLAIAFRRILSQNPALGRGTVIALCIAGGWTLIGYIWQLLIAHSAMAGSWREFVIMALLPAIGVAHLIAIGKCSPGTAHHVL
jgi:hypothetical protein